MIEEKIREPEQQAPSAPQRPSSGKEKLLSLWARIELIGVLRRHHIRKWIAAGLSRIFRLLTSNPMAHKLGGALYGLGFSGEYALVRLGRILMAAALRVGRTLWRELSNLEEMAFPEVLLVLKELFGPFYVFFRGMRNLYIHGRNVRRERGFAAGLRESAAYLGRGFLRYVGLLPRTAAYLLPLPELRAVLDQLGSEPGLRELPPKERARTAETLLRAAADRQGLELKLRRNPKTQS